MSFIVGDAFLCVFLEATFFWIDSFLDGDGIMFFFTGRNKNINQEIGKTGAYIRKTNCIESLSSMV